MVFTNTSAGVLLSALLLSPALGYAVQAPLPAIAVATATRGPWQPRWTAFGRMQSAREATLRAPFGARVLEAEAGVGERVRRGQVLARLQAPRLTALLERLNAARREVGLAKRRLDVLARGLREQAVTRSTELEAGIALSQAKSRLAGAWQALDDVLLALGQRPDHAAITRSMAKSPLAYLARSLSVVRAPFNGLLADRHIAAGQWLAPAASMFTLEDLARVYVEVGVPRERLADWQGGTAAIPLPNGSQTLTRVPARPRLDPGSGLWLLRFIADHPGSQPQEGAWVKVYLSGPVRTVVWVPRASVVARDGKTYCIRERQGAFEAVAVSVGPATGGRIPVLSGLKVGDRVATEGAYELLYRDLKELMKFVD